MSLPGTDQPTFRRRSNNGNHGQQNSEEIHALPGLEGGQVPQGRPGRPAPEVSTRRTSHVYPTPSVRPPAVRPTQVVRRAPAIRPPICAPTVISPSAVRSSSKPPPSNFSGASDVRSTVEGELSPSTAGASVLSSPKGQIGVTGGTFNAVGGNLVTVHVNLNGSKEGGQADTIIAESAPKEIMESQIQDTGSIVLPDSPKSSTSKSSSESLEARSPESRIWAHENINDVYYQCLASKKRGSPLWIPGTNEQFPIEYQRKGLMIGDVGMITDRGFYDSLFNITLLPDHPLAINPDELPANFSPLELRPRDLQRYSEFKQRSYLSSASIRNSCDNDNPSGIIFESSASEGAILTLSNGSNSEDLGNKRRLREYLFVHAEEMYRCALFGHGRIITNGDLRVITGHDKAKRWGMAAFSNSTAQTDSFRLRFRPRDEGDIGWVHSWESSGTAEVKAGPDICETVALRMNDPSQQDVEYENQSVFVRTTNITLQKGVWTKLLSELGEVESDDGSENPYYRSSRSTPGSSPTRPSTSSPGTTFDPGCQSAPGGNSQSTRLSDSANSLTVHPSNRINEILLMLNPDARMAITEDEDWISVLTEEDSTLPPTEHLWARIKEDFIICEADGAVFLEKISLTASPTHAEVFSTPESLSLDPTDMRPIESRRTEPTKPNDFPNSLFLAPSPLLEKEHGTDDSQTRPSEWEANSSSLCILEPTKSFGPCLDLKPLLPVNQDSIISMPRNAHPGDTDVDDLPTNGFEKTSSSSTTPTSPSMAGGSSLQRPPLSQGCLLCRLNTSTGGESGSTIRCSSCSEWYHRACVSLFDIECHRIVCERSKDQNPEHSVKREEHSEANSLVSGLSIEGDPQWQRGTQLQPVNPFMNPAEIGMSPPFQADYDDEPVIFDENSSARDSILPVQLWDYDNAGTFLTALGHSGSDAGSDSEGIRSCFSSPSFSPSLFPSYDFELETSVSQLSLDNNAPLSATSLSRPEGSAGTWYPETPPLYRSDSPDSPSDSSPVPSPRRSESQPYNSHGQKQDYVAHPFAQPALTSSDMVSPTFDGIDGDLSSKDAAEIQRKVMDTQSLSDARGDEAVKQLFGKVAKNSVSTSAGRQASQKRRIHLSKWKCAICGDGFTRRAGLKNHMKSHVGVTDHECQYCHSVFNTSPSRHEERCGLNPGKDKTPRKKIPTWTTTENSEMPAPFTPYHHNGNL